MARSSCHGFGGAKQRRLERLVRRQRYDSPGNTTSTRALCPPKPHGPGAPALNPPRMLAEATRSTARCDTLHNPPEGDRDSPPRRAKTRTRPKPSVTQPGTTRRENPGCPMGACANQRDTAQPKPTTVSSLTPELSRAAKRRRLERIVRQQHAPHLRHCHPFSLPLQAPTNLLHNQLQRVPESKPARATQRPIQQHCREGRILRRP